MKQWMMVCLVLHRAVFTNGQLCIRRASAQPQDETRDTCAEDTEWSALCEADIDSIMPLCRMIIDSSTNLQICTPTTPQVSENCTTCPHCSICNCSVTPSMAVSSPTTSEDQTTTVDHLDLSSANTSKNQTTTVDQLNSTSTGIPEDHTAKIIDSGICNNTFLVSSTECRARDVTILVLVVVSTILLLALVGVVMGWVWSCHRNRRSKQSDVQDTMQQNPAYVQATPTQPSINYSSLGPQDTPTGNTPPRGEERIYHVVEQPPEEREEERVYHVLEQPEMEGEGGEERIYHVLEQPGMEEEEEEERIYHVLEQPERDDEEREDEDVYHMLGEAREGQEEEEEGGMAYEVPVQSKKQESAEDMDYSKLHHK